MTTPDPSAAMERAAAAWLVVCDDVLAGLTHALNNRLAALSSITRVIEYGDLSLVSTLTQEIEDLEGTVQLLQALPAYSEDGVEPVHLGDVLRTLVDLQRLRRETRDLHYRVAIDPSTPPVLADPVLLTRALLLLLGDVAHHALRNEQEVLIATEVADPSVSIRLSIGGGRSASISGRTRDAAGVLLETCGGTIVAEDGSERGLIEVVVPVA